MTDNAQRILRDALDLSEKERAEVASSLLDSLDQSADERSREDWDAEVERRIAEIDRGDVRLINWSDARNQLFGKYDDAPGI